MGEGHILSHYFTILLHVQEQFICLLVINILNYMFHVAKVANLNDNPLNFIGVLVRPCHELCRVSHFYKLQNEPLTKWERDIYWNSRWFRQSTVLWKECLKLSRHIFDCHTPQIWKKSATRKLYIKKRVSLWFLTVWRGDIGVTRQNKLRP